MGAGSTIRRLPLLPESELLVWCARTVMTDDLKTRIRQRVQELLDWSILGEMAEYHGVIPLLYRNLSAVAPDLVPADLDPEERNRLIEDCGIAGGADVMRGNEWKPEKIVTDPGPDAGAGLWMPPVLDITFYELSCGGAQDVVAREFRRRVHKGHDILQLISESVGTARLIKSRAAPNPAAQSLVKQPAVEQNICRKLRRFHFNRA